MPRYEVYDRTAYEDAGDLILAEFGQCGDVPPEPAWHRSGSRPHPHAVSPLDRARSLAGRRKLAEIGVISASCVWWQI